MIVPEGPLRSTCARLQYNWGGKIGTRRECARRSDLATFSPYLVTVLVEVTKTVSCLNRYAVCRPQHNGACEVHVITDAILIGTVDIVHCRQNR